MSFRLAVLAIFILLGIAGSWFRLRARTGESISYRNEGLGPIVLLKLLGLCFGITTIAYMFNTTWIQRFGIPLPDWLRWTGFGCAIVSFGCLWWTLTWLGKNLTDTVVTRANAVLVTGGPYRWVRHPFYLLVVILMFSVAITAANWLLAVLGLLIAILFVLRTTKEERNLVKKFGSEYERYTAVTGKILPKVRW